MTDLIKTDSRYLHGEDLRRGGTPCDVTMVVKEVADKDSAKTETKQVIKGWPVHFEKTDKILVLNGTNTKLAIAAMGSNDRGDWIGKKLTVYPAVLDECFGQQNVICVRVRVPDGMPKPFIMPRHLGKDMTSHGSNTA